MVSLLCGLPVDYLPDILDVLSFAAEILICMLARGAGINSKRAPTCLEIISMFPHIHPKDGDLPTDNRVLVFRRHDPQPPSLFLDQPPPAATLDAQQRRREDLLEPRQVAPGGGNVGNKGGGCSRRVCVRAIGGRQVLPEQRVVYVSAGVELDGGLQGYLAGNVVCLDGCCVGLNCLI